MNKNYYYGVLRVADYGFGAIAAKSRMANAVDTKFQILLFFNDLYETGYLRVFGISDNKFSIKT